MPSAYEILKGALVDAGFNDGRQFTNTEARDVAVSLFEEEGHADPHKKVSCRLRKMQRMGDLIRVKKGVYKFAKPVGAKKPLFYKHRPGRPGTYHMLTNVRKMIVNHDDNPQPNPTDWVLQGEWDDV